MGPLGKSLGMGKRPAYDDEEEEGDGLGDGLSMSEEPAESESSVPPDFQSAYDDYMQTPSAESMYAMIEACKSGGGEKSPGLALILGGKGKKP